MLVEEYSADPTIANKRKQTPIDLAKKYDLDEILNILNKGKK